MLTVYVDDITADIGATERIIRNELVPVVQSIAEGLEAMRLELSPTKNIVFSSSLQLSKAIAKPLHRWNVKPVIV